MPETFLSIDALLERMVARNASDLHVTVGTPPAMRVHGVLDRYEDVPPLTPEDTHQLLYRILSTEQQKLLEINRQIDLAGKHLPCRHHHLHRAARLGWKRFGGTLITIDDPAIVEFRHN